MKITLQVKFYVLQYVDKTTFCHRGGVMAKKKQTKRKKWIKFRHHVIASFLYPILYLLVFFRYRIRTERFKGPKKRNYLILLNHQTPFDQFFVGLSFRKPIYYMATEDIFSMGFLSSVIKWLVAPIPIKKQTTDLAAVMTSIRVAKEGGSIAIAPEGNRTYSGKTEYMAPAIAALAKKMRLPIALYRIEGGYGVEPRWTDKIRRGKMRCYVSRVIEPEEYDLMTNDELFEVIREGLYVNEAVVDCKYRSKRRAEYLDRAIYVCPDCGFSVFYSHKNEITCQRCMKSVEYGEDKRLAGVGFEFPFTFVNDWYEYQKDFLNAFDLADKTDTPLFADTASLYEVVVYKKKYRLRKSACLTLYGDRIEIDAEGSDPLTFAFNEISTLAVLGRNKANIYIGDKVYQVKGDKHFNALKYVNFYYRYCNQTSGEKDGKFLGI